MVQPLVGRLSDGQRNEGGSGFLQVECCGLGYTNSALGEMTSDIFSPRMEI